MIYFKQTQRHGKSEKERVQSLLILLKASEVKP